MTNNIIYNTLGTEIYSWRDWRAPAPKAGMAKSIGEADKNIFYDKRKRYLIGFGLGRPISVGAVEITLDDWRKTYGLDRASVVGDPGFVDAARHDYTVKAGSPALALGFTNIDQSTIGLLPNFPFKTD